MSIHTVSLSIYIYTVHELEGELNTPTIYSEVELLEQCLFLFF